MKAIMYHYVRPAPEQLPYFRYLHIDDFARQLDWFARHDRFLSREEFCNACETGDARDGIVLTFDDGLADHYSYVLPLLVERGLFGIFYVCTAPLERASFWTYIASICCLAGWAVRRPCGGFPSVSILPC